MLTDPDKTPATELRKLAAIMFTDIVGFSRQMGADEARMLRLLEVHNQLIQQAVTEHHGHVIKTIGDAFLVEFPSVVNAVQCAQVIHAQLRTYNAEKESAKQIHVRIGIHLGDVVQKDGDVFGDGVNIASRLQSLAEPDTICISEVVYRDVSQETVAWDGGLSGHDQAQEHRPALPSLRASARTSQGLPSDSASPTPEALTADAPDATRGGGGTAARRRTVVAFAISLRFHQSPTPSP